MDNQLRQASGWMQAALWLVAAAFAAFLIGLGGKVLDKLWDVAPPVAIGHFIEPGEGAKAQAVLRQADVTLEAARLRLEQARHKHNVAKANTALARESFDRWVAARDASVRPDQDAELVARTAELDQVRAAEQVALDAVLADEQVRLLAGQQREQAVKRWRDIERAALARLETARWQQQLHMFLYRLAVTLPLVLLACWLFATRRDSAWWPFVWGFMFFAAFTFFAELVPYVPSYSGYVRYIVGILVTVLVGRFAIVSLQSGDAPVRSREHSYDTQAARLADAVCPGCLRPVDLHAQEQDFCTHCGLRLFNRCSQCKTRKAAFARFCATCGTPDGRDQPDPGVRNAA